MTTKHKRKPPYKRYDMQTSRYRHIDISNILSKTETVFDAMEQFMQKYDLPKIKVELECKIKNQYA